MKKIFAILFAMLIVLSGMHLTIATHICGGEIASVEWSFSGQKATCGMETDEQACPTQKSLSSNCCQNNISVYSVDNNYNTSFQIKDLTPNIIQVFVTPVSLLFNSTLVGTSINSISHSSGSLPAIGVSLSDICIFRI